MNKPKWWAAITIAVLSITTIIVVALLGYGLNAIPVGRFTPEIVLPIVLLFGVITMLSALTVVATALSALGLSDKTQALGMPKGTIRSLVALLLIVMFAIVSVFLYRELAKLDDPDPSIRFAEQILTTVATLVVAVAGFYFGTRAVETASPAAVAARSPLPETVAPAESAEPDEPAELSEPAEPVEPEPESETGKSSN